MGIMGSAFGRGLAAGGTSAAQIANKYIDQELAMQRDQALADIQYANTVRTEEYQQSAPVQARRTENAAAGTLAQAAAARKAKTEGAADTGYQAALDAEADAETGRKVRSTNQVTEGTTEAEVKRLGILGKAKTAEEVARAEALLPIEVKAAFAKADAAGRASARNREAPGAELAAKLRIVEQTMGRPLTEAEKLGLLGLAKGGTPKDSKYDYEEIVTESVDAAGGTKKTTSYQPRGAGGPAESGDPIRAAMDAARKAREGGGAAPAATGASRVPTRKDPLSGQDLTEREWDRKFGRGDFKKEAKDGLPSMRPF